MFGKLPLVSDLISEEIAQRGPMTFARFMDLALYHPESGYYSSGRAAIGKEGDFFTNVSVGPVFGKLLAAQFEEMWHRLGCPDPFFIIEQGAHDGRLAGDILTALPEEFALAARYILIEPSPILRAKQEENLKDWREIASWVAQAEDLPSGCGVHFSNELVDALPFHLIESSEEGWRELRVDHHDHAFSFRSGPPSPEISHLVEGLPARPVGTLAELRPAAADWLRTVTARLSAGFILIVDYGYGREQLRASHRTKGTFSCYRGHRRDDNVLADPGDKDITAHVDFTQLAEVAAEVGWELEGFADQHHFLVGAAESILRSFEASALTPEKQKTLRALQTLLHPESMGTQFRYLGFSKNAGATGSLSGFRHSRNAEIQ